MKKSRKCLALLLALLMMFALLPAAALAEAEPSEEPTEEALAADSAPAESPEGDSPVVLTGVGFDWGNAGDDGQLMAALDTESGIFLLYFTADPTLAPDTDYSVESGTFITFSDEDNDPELTSGNLRYSYVGDSIQISANLVDENGTQYAVNYSAELLQPDELSVTAAFPKAGQTYADWEASVTAEPEYAGVSSNAVHDGEYLVMDDDEPFIPGETYALSFVPYLETDDAIDLDPRADFTTSLSLGDGSLPVRQEQNGNMFSLEASYTVPLTADVCDWVYAPKIADILTVSLSGEKDMEDCNWLLSLRVDSKTLLTEDALSIVPDPDRSIYYPDGAKEPLTVTDGEITYLENKDARTLHVEGWFETEDGTVREFSYDGALICPGDIATTAPMPADGESFEDWQAKMTIAPIALNPAVLFNPIDDAREYGVFYGGVKYEITMMFSAPDGYTFSFDHDFREDLTFADRHVWFENMGAMLSYYAEQVVPEAPAPTPAAPKTGDNGHALLWAVLALGLGSVAVVLGKKKFN